MDIRSVAGGTSRSPASQFCRYSSGSLPKSSGSGRWLEGERPTFGFHLFNHLTRLRLSKNTTRLVKEARISLHYAPARARYVPTTSEAVPLDSFRSSNHRSKLALAGLRKAEDSPRGFLKLYIITSERERMNTTPWSSQSHSMNPSPTLTPASEAGPSSAPPSTNFSSSWGAFGLAQPRSNLTMQLESHPIEQTSIFQRRSNSSSNGQGASSAFGRRQSMLGLDSAMIDDEELASSLTRMGATGTGGDMSMSASIDQILPSSSMYTMSSRSARSRSASESASHHPFQPPPPLFGNVPPSPVTVARALQAGQKTPPAIFQRRLFKDEHMVDDGSNSEARSSRSGSSYSAGQE